MNPLGLFSWTGGVPFVLRYLYLKFCSAASLHGPSSLNSLQLLLSELDRIQCKYNDRSLFSSSQIEFCVINDKLKSDAFLKLTKISKGERRLIIMDFHNGFSSIFR